MVTINKNVVDFAAHCPKCGGKEWMTTGTPDAVKCATVDCAYVHWLKNEPPESIGQAAADAYREVARTRANASSKAKRDRVRSLVHAMLMNPVVRPGLVMPDKLVMLAKTIDDEIEKIDVPKAEA